MTSNSVVDSQIALYRQLDGYPWEQDEEFQGGLRAILGPVQDPSQIEHLTLRAKCYYYARKAGLPVDFDGYKQWIESGRVSSGSINGINNAATPLDFTPEDTIPPTATTTTTATIDSGLAGDGGAGGLDTAPRPASFAEICEMIAEGKPIPGIKDIPDTILEGQASESAAVKRKKPWENGDAEAGVKVEKPSWMR